jgi:hypothetical protein
MHGRHARSRLLTGGVLVVTAAMLLVPAQQAAATATPECAAGGVKVVSSASPAAVTVNDTTTSTPVQVQVTITGTTFTITPTDAAVTLDSASWCLKASTKTQTGLGTAGTSTITNAKGVAQKIGYLIIYSVGTSAPPTPTCYEAGSDFNEDAAFVGPVGELGNLRLYRSYDGTCTGPLSYLLTVVSGTTQAEATTACQALGRRGADFPMISVWPTASDLWVCLPG